MNKIKQIRERKGLSQSELSKKSGVSINVLRSYEQGRRDFYKASIKNGLKISEALGVDIHDLL